MRKMMLLSFVCMVANRLPAQQKQGKVMYERTIQMQIVVNDNDAVSQMLPKSRTDKFELVFGNNQSLWKHVDEEENDDDFGGNGIHINMLTPGQNDIAFYDFTKSKKIEQKEMFDKNFIVEDSIRKFTWKLTGETQTILGHVCQKASAQDIGKHLQMTMDNGKTEKKEITDTSMIVAWFTADVPVPAGPEVQGQLPGLILALEMNHGRTVYKALEISDKADLASIKPPSKGKKVTPQEFADERTKMLNEMQTNNSQGDSHRFIIRD